MSTRTRMAILLALSSLVGFAMGCYFAHNDPDMLTVVAMSAALVTALYSLSWWSTRTKRVLRDRQGN
jgi:hypothetical protein